MSANENKGRQNGVFYQMKVLSVHIKDSQRIESWVCKESDTTECAHTHMHMLYWRRRLLDMKELVPYLLVQCLYCD